MRIEFENAAPFITAFDDVGRILVRCNFDFTDCGETESLDNFVARHGGAEATPLSLNDCYRKN